MNLKIVITLFAFCTLGCDSTNITNPEPEDSCIDLKAQRSLEMENVRGLTTLNVN